MLSLAREELAPSQWELLESKLTAAERAFERFDRVASASGKVALVARGAEQLSRAGRAAETIEGGTRAVRAGPLLVLLILLWPSETADPEHDHGPDWLVPEEDFKAKLRDLSQVAMQVQSELAAARRVRSDGIREREPERAAKRYTDKPPKPNSADVADPKWQPPSPNAPRYLPCVPAGHGGPGPFRPERAPSDWIRCSYRCGRYEVHLYDIRRKKDENGKPKDAQKICEEWINLKRAEEHARTKDDTLKEQGD